MSEKTLMERLNESISLQNKTSKSYDKLTLPEQIFIKSSSDNFGSDYLNIQNEHNDAKNTSHDYLVKDASKKDTHKLGFSNLFESSTTDKTNSEDFSIDEKKKDKTISILDSTIMTNDDNINININNHDFKIIVNRTIVNILLYLYRNNFKYSVCGSKGYINLLCKGNLYNVKKIKQNNEEFKRILSSIECNILISKKKDIKTVVILAQKVFDVYLKNVYENITFNTTDNDTETVIYLDEPKINLLTVTSSLTKLSLKKAIIFCSLLLNFSLNNILNKNYYCRLISLYINDKKIFFNILNDLKNILHGNHEISMFKLNNNDFYFDSNGIVYMGLYNSLFTLTQQLCHESESEINNGLDNVISKLIENKKLNLEDLFSINIDNEKINFIENKNIFDSKLYENIENMLITKLNNMMKTKNRLRIVGSNNNYSTVNSLLFIDIETNYNNTIFSKIKSIAEYAINSLVLSKSSDASSIASSKESSETKLELNTYSESESALNR